LVHHPVLDRSGGVITTAITNLDLHDIARSSRTYGVSDYFVVHPVEAQRQLAEKVRDHWLVGSGSRRIPDRIEAMNILRVMPSLQDVFQAFGGRSEVEVWTTSARLLGKGMSLAEARKTLDAPGRPVLILFGTGWGLAKEVVEDADVHLVPIRALAHTGFNHLSVRAACAITLDRLLGDG
jgi:hypothetical protein